MYVWITVAFSQSLGQTREVHLTTKIRRKFFPFPQTKYKIEVVVVQVLYVCMYLTSKALFFIIKVVKSSYDLFSVREAASEKCMTGALCMRNRQKGGKKMPREPGSRFSWRGAILEGSAIDLHQLPTHPCASAEETPSLSWVRTNKTLRWRGRWKSQ